MASLDKSKFVSNILKYTTATTTTTTTTSTRNIDINKQDDNKSDDDETIWFTENDTQESGNDSDIQESDDSDFEIVEANSDDDDYSNNLFTVEFNDDDDDDSNDYQEERENILQANKRWNGDIDIDHCSCTPAKVTFSDDVEIYPAGDFCRKSPWEIYALDRMRFRRRIEETERILYRILSSEHRRKVLSRI